MPDNARSYSIDAAQRVVLVRFSGRLTARDIARYADSLRQDPRFDPSYAEIVDLREVEEFEIGPKEAIALADIVDPFDQNSFRAFVAHDEVQSNPARMHQLLRSPTRRIAIFDSLEKAEHWVRTGASSGGEARLLYFPQRPS